MGTLLVKQIYTYSLHQRIGVDIFSDKLVGELTVVCLTTVERDESRIVAIECGPDHLHLFVRNWKN